MLSPLLLHIMHIFITIYPYSGDMTSCCRKSKGFRSLSTFDRQRKQFWLGEHKCPLSVGYQWQRSRLPNLDLLKIDLDLDLLYVRSSRPSLDCHATRLPNLDLLKIDLDLLYIRSSRANLNCHAT